MSELLDKEIEELFEQLIVVKVKEQIDALGKKIEGIEESGENIEDSLEKIVKPHDVTDARRGIEEKIEEIISEEGENIRAVFKEKFDENIKKLGIYIGKQKEEIIKLTGEQITNIDTYLKQECKISSGEKLGEYIEESWNIVRQEIEKCLEAEGNCLESCTEIKQMLTKVEDDLSDILKKGKSEIISAINESRDKINAQNDEIIKYQIELQNDLNEKEQSWTKKDRKIDTIIEEQKNSFEKMKNLEENILKNVNEIEGLQTNVTNMMQVTESIDISWKEKYQKLSIIVKMLLIGEGVSILGLGIMICKLFVG